MRRKETSSLLDETDVAHQIYLSHKECCNLVYRAKDGDKTAESQIVEASLRLVSSIARKYGGCGLEFDEITQVGNLGVMRAIEKFEPEKGFKFSTYATIWIKHFINYAIMKQSLIVHIPAKTQAKIKSNLRRRAQITQNLQREPAHQEWIVDTSLKPAEMNLLKRIDPYNYQLDQSLRAKNQEIDDLESFTEAQSAVNLEEEIMKLLLKEHFDDILNRLPQREQKIIKMRFGRDEEDLCSFRRIGQELNLSGERIRQITVQILEQLRQLEEIKSLKVYMD